jgi:hypothetical protein
MATFKILKEKDKWKTFSLNTANFILLEAKDYLDYSINESDKITKRTYTLIIGMGTILTAIVGYTFDKVLEDNISEIIFMNFFLCIILSFFLIYLGRVLFPRKLMVKGRQPKELAISKIIYTPELSKEENYLAIVIQEIENIQRKIDYNLALNNRRRNKLKITMISISILFPLYLILAFYIAS